MRSGRDQPPGPGVHGGGGLLQHPFKFRVLLRTPTSETRLYEIEATRRCHCARDRSPCDGCRLHGFRPSLKPRVRTQNSSFFLNGEISAVQLKAQAGDNRDRRTEALTFIGCKAYYSGGYDVAEAEFAWVEERGNNDFLEYQIATAELARLRDFRRGPSQTPPKDQQSQVTYRVTGIKNSDTLNVRLGPGASSRSVGYLEYNTNQIVVVGQPVNIGGDLWVPIRIDGHLPHEGWVNFAFLTQEKKR